MIKFNSLIPVSKITCNGLAIKLAFLVDSIWLFANPSALSLIQFFVVTRPSNSSRRLILAVEWGLGKTARTSLM